MAQSFPGFPSPAASFDTPLEMLASCHERMERQLTTLERLGAHIAQHGADESAQEAARRVITYFDTAAVHHHADEEENVFPALLEAVAGSDAVCIRELTDTLRSDHRQLEKLWRSLRPQLQGLLSCAPPASASLDGPIVTQFIATYRSHLKREDDELLPLAERLLGQPERERIGRAMKTRREQAYGNRKD